MEETSARDAWRSAVTFFRWSPTRFVSQTKSGKEREGEHRQPPVEEHHRDDGGEHGRDVREHGGRGRGDDCLDAADVVGDPALHLPGARAREEREREPLQMPVHLGAQVVHDALPYAVGQQRLPDTERAGDDRDHDHARHERRQQAEVLLGNSDVEHLAKQERGDDAEARRDEDQARDRRHPGAIRAEEPDDPPEVGLPHGRVGGALGRVAAGKGVETTAWHLVSVPATG